MNREKKKQAIKLLLQLKSDRDIIVNSGGGYFVNLSDGTFLSKYCGVCKYAEDVMGTKWLSKWIKQTYGTRFPVELDDCGGKNLYKISYPAEMWCEGDYAEARWKFIDDVIERLENAE